MQINFLAFTGIVNLLASTFLGTYILIKNRANALSKSFFHFNLFIAVFSFGYFFWQMSSSPETALRWFKVLLTGAIFINVTYLHFIFSLVGILDKKKTAFAFLYLINIVFVYLNLASRLYTGVEARFGLGYLPVPTPLFAVYVGFWFLECFYGLYWLTKGLRASQGVKREQFKYVLVAAAIGFFGGATNWPMVFGMNVPPYLNILISAAVAFITYAIAKYRLLNVTVFFARTVMFLFISVLVIGVPLTIGYLYGEWKTATYLGMILATAGPIIYYIMQHRAEKLLLAEQRSYQKILMQASEGMAREHDLDRLLNFIVHIIRRSVRTAFVAVFVEDKETESYVLRAIRSNVNNAPWVIFPFTHPLIEFLKKKREPCAWEELPEELRKQMDTGMNVSLIVPSFIEKRLMGFLFLGAKQNNSLYTRDDITVFITLANQAALAVENCRFMEKSKTTQEQLFNAEKLTLIGGLTDGLAHQMKNRLSQFALAGGEMALEIDDIQAGLNEFFKNPAQLRSKLIYLKTCADSIADNVKKTDLAIQNVLQFARPDKKGNSFAMLSLGELVAQSRDLLKVKHHIVDFPLTADLGEDDKIFASKPQMLECLINILDNAYEAVDEKINRHLKEEERKSFTPLLKVSLAQNETSSLITITDNGSGIKDDDKPKIFDAFFTTKTAGKMGSGIGGYVVKRMIEENHKGKIWFESEYGRGTTFFIEIPRNVMTQ